MQVGIVSDTHDNTGLVDAAVDTFADAGVETVVHCGDFVAPFSATPWDGDWEFYAVRGNNDGEWDLQSAVEEFGTYMGEMGELTLDGAEVAVYHGTSGAIVDALVECGTYDYVFTGHTHDRGTEEYEGTTRINPGGIGIPPAPDDFSVATLDTDSGDVTFRELE
ncbi:metallophosphoesterase [Haloarcula nitratireducens]|uniref:Phosphoesterase n=1 Tax=Haloarcula nitratireducens TaxID=2487749 RepID=A0AAW4PCJ1_9EURY|nr:metallophosphoesterase [Halomicroarcula nitratireducens]MBX0295564.1 metallophosphoesterase [Halomicroarcula nitratireducens]